MRESLSLRTDSPEATRELGAKLGRALLAEHREQPIVVALNGDLGAGKTTFVSGLLHGLGQRGAIKSPTYTLIETYELQGRQFHHLDLYRLNDAAELEALGFRDLLQPGAVVLIEWAERAAEVRAVADVRVGITYVSGRDQGRQFELTASSETGAALVRTASF